MEHSLRKLKREKARRSGKSRKSAKTREVLVADEIGPDDKTGTAGFWTESVAP